MTLGCLTACVEQDSDGSSSQKDNGDETIVETSLTDATTSSSVQHTEKPEPTATLTPTPAPTATPIPTVTPTPPSSLEPTGTTNPPPTPETDDYAIDNNDECVYVTRTGNKYHTESCRYAHGSGVQEMTEKEARERGYTPCKICH